MTCCCGCCEKTNRLQQLSAAVRGVKTEEEAITETADAEIQNAVKAGTSVPAAAAVAGTNANEPSDPAITAADAEIRNAARTGMNVPAATAAAGTDAGETAETDVPRNIWTIVKAETGHVTHAPTMTK